MSATPSAAASPALVEVRNLRTSLGGKVIFDGVDLDVPRGKITAIMGPSGTGKTTMLRHITGQLAPDSGPIRVDGPMRDPGIQPEAGNLAGRTTAAVLLGVLLTPLAAIIPTLELGLGEDSDCKGLITQVRQSAANRNMPIQTPTKPAAPPPVAPTK